jgi:hypothetical protein
MLLPLTTIFGQTGYSYALGPAVSERRALPAIRGSQIPPSADLFRPTVARLTLRSATSSADFRIVFHW